MSITHTLSATSTVSPDDIARRTIGRRAVESVIWGMPAVNFDRMYQAMVHDAKAGEGSNKIVYRSRPVNWRNQTPPQPRHQFTSCPSSIRRTSAPWCWKSRLRTMDLLPARWTTAGRPPSKTWAPPDVDQGNGGKYLILPPGSKNPISSRLHPLAVGETYQGYALLRSNLKSSSEIDVAAAVSYGKRCKVLPALEGRSSPRHAIRRRHRCNLRRHHSIRPALLPVLLIA